jgi:hypothetical protein
MSYYLILVSCCLSIFFLQMDKNNYPPISDKLKWIDYTDTKPDY